MKVALSGIPGEQAGAATGTYGLFRDLAAPFGVAVLVPMFTNQAAQLAAQGRTGAEAAVQAMHTLGTVELICVAAGCLVVALLPRIHPERRKEHAAER
jgi:hypothetical protein